MAIRSIFGLDDVVLPSAPPTTPQVFPGLPFTFTPGIVGSTAVTYAKDAGWLKMTTAINNGNAGNKQNFFSCTMQQLGLTPTPTSEFTIGMRWLCPQSAPSITSWPHPFVFVTAISVANANTAAVFGFNNIVPALVANVEYYLEATFDLTAGTMKRYVDGALIDTIAIPATPLAGMRAGTALFASGVPYQGGGTNVDYSYWIKDFYVSEKTSDGTANGPLGPQRIVPITVASVDQPTWAATGAADAVTALNTPITDAASQLTPVVVSDTAAPSTNVALTSELFLGPVNAVVLRMTARKNNGAAGQVAARVTTGADNSPDVTASLSNAMSITNIYQSEKSPSGVKWTRASLQSAVLKLSVL
jgi:hypothetical protein